MTQKARVCKSLHCVLLAVLLGITPWAMGCADPGSDLEEVFQSEGKGDSGETVGILGFGLAELAYDDDGWHELSGGLIPGGRFRLLYSRRRAVKSLEQSGCRHTRGFADGVAGNHSLILENYSVMMNPVIEFLGQEGVIFTTEVQSLDSIEETIYIPEGTESILIYSRNALLGLESGAPLCESRDDNLDAGYTFPVQKAAPVMGTLGFNDDWSLEQSGKLIRGSSIRVRYEASRAHELLEQAWADDDLPPRIVMHVRFGGSPFLEVPMGSFQPSEGGGFLWEAERPLVYLPESEDEMRLYFEITGGAGPAGRDDNSSEGYNFQLN